MRSAFLMDALAYHLHETRNAYDSAPSVQESNFPVGAMIVAGCAVCALQYIL